MRIGIDVRSLQTESGWRGVGVYTRHLVETLMRIDAGNEYFLFASSRGELQHLPDDVRKKIIPLKRPARKIIFWDQLFWYHLLKNWKIDIFHSPFYASPLLIPKQVAVVQTVHDLIPLIFKESTSFKNRLIFRMNFFLLKHTDRIIAVSQNTKNDIIRLLKIPEEKVVVIHNGVNHLQRMDQKEGGEPSRRDAERERPFLLYAGGLDPLKNIPVLIQAFDKIGQKNKDVKLVMVGVDGEKMRHLKVRLKGTGAPDLKSGKQFNALLDKLLHSGKIVLKGYLKSADLISYYRNAELFLFPSLYEGFGLPPLEAMSYGIPVIASNRSSLPEILGDAALYANPEDAEELARRANHLLHNKSLQAELKEAGFQQAARFLWEDAAKKTLALYHALVQEKRSDASSDA